MPSLIAQTGSSIHDEPILVTAFRAQLKCFVQFIRLKSEHGWCGLAILRTWVEFHSFGVLKRLLRTFEFSAGCQTLSYHPNPHLKMYMCTLTWTLVTSQLAKSSLRCASENWILKVSSCSRIWCPRLVRTSERCAQVSGFGTLGVAVSETCLQVRKFYISRAAFSTGFVSSSSLQCL